VPPDEQPPRAGGEQLPESQPAEAVEHGPPDPLAPHEVADPIHDVPTTVSRNVRWNFIGHFWTLAVTLIATPIIIRRLGVDAYGIIATLAIITNYMAFFDLGLSQATIKHVAEFRARREWHGIRLVLWTSVIGYVGLGVLAALLVVILSPVAATRWFRIPEILQPAAIGAFYVGAVGVFLVLVNFGPTSLMKGLERFDLVNKVGMLVGTAQPVITLGLVVAGASLPAIIAGNVVALGVTVALNIFFARRLLGDFGRPAWDTHTFIRLARYGGYLAAASILAPLAVNAEKLLLAGAVSVGALTYYMVPQSLVARLAIIPASFSSALFPAFAALHSAGEHESNVRLNVEVARTLIYLFAPIVIVLVAAGDMLLGAWMGSDFAFQSAGPLKILTVAALIQAMAWTPHILVQAVGRTDITFRIYLLQVVVYLPLAYLMVARWGLDGAAWAWLLRVTLDAALVWYFAQRLAGLSAWALVRDRRVLATIAGLLLVIAGQIIPQLSVWRLPLTLAGTLVTGVAAGPELWTILQRLASGHLAERWQDT
jgi:O-antigen/teichoic acid export membrane protein